MFEKCNSEETKNNAINVLDKFYKYISIISKVIFVLFFICIILFLCYSLVKNIIANIDFSIENVTFWFCVCLWILLQTILISSVFIFCINFTPLFAKHYIMKYGLCKPILYQTLLLMMIIIFCYLDYYFGFLNLSNDIKLSFVLIGVFLSVIIIAFMFNFLSTRFFPYNKKESVC